MVAACLLASIIVVMVMSACAAATDVATFVDCVREPVITTLFQGINSATQIVYNISESALYAVDGSSTFKQCNIATGSCNSYTLGNADDIMSITMSLRHNLLFFGCHNDGIFVVQNHQKLFETTENEYKKIDIMSFHDSSNVLWFVGQALCASSKRRIARAVFHPTLQYFDYSDGYSCFNDGEESFSSIVAYDASVAYCGRNNILGGSYVVKCTYTSSVSCSVWAGKTTGVGDRDGTDPRFDTVGGLFLIGDRLFIGDQKNYKIRWTNIKFLNVTRIAGEGNQGATDGHAITEAKLQEVLSLTNISETSILFMEKKSSGLTRTFRKMEFSSTYSDQFFSTRVCLDLDRTLDRDVVFDNCTLRNGLKIYSSSPEDGIVPSFNLRIRRSSVSLHIHTDGNRGNAVAMENIKVRDATIELSGNDFRTDESACLKARLFRIHGSSALLYNVSIVVLSNNWTLLGSCFARARAFVWPSATTLSNATLRFEKNIFHVNGLNEGSAIDLRPITEVSNLEMLFRENEFHVNSTTGSAFFVKLEMPSKELSGATIELIDNVGKLTCITQCVFYLEKVLGATKLSALLEGNTATIVANNSDALGVSRETSWTQDCYFNFSHNSFELHSAEQAKGFDSADGQVIHTTFVFDTNTLRVYGNQVRAFKFGESEGDLSVTNEVTVMMINNDIEVVAAAAIAITFSSLANSSSWKLSDNIINVTGTGDIITSDTAIICGVASQHFDSSTFEASNNSIAIGGPLAKTNEGSYGYIAVGFLTIAYSKLTFETNTLSVAGVNDTTTTGFAILTKISVSNVSFTKNQIEVESPWGVCGMWFNTFAEANFNFTQNTINTTSLGHSDSSAIWMEKSVEDSMLNFDTNVLESTAANASYGVTFSQAVTSTALTVRNNSLSVTGAVRAIGFDASVYHEGASTQYTMESNSISVNCARTSCTGQGLGLVGDGKFSILNNCVNVSSVGSAVALMMDCSGPEVNVSLESNVLHSSSSAAQGNSVAIKGPDQCSGTTIHFDFNHNVLVAHGALDYLSTGIEISSRCSAATDTPVFALSLIRNEINADVRAISISSSNPIQLQTLYVERNFAYMSGKRTYFVFCEQTDICSSTLTFKRNSVISPGVSPEISFLALSFNDTKATMECNYLNGGHWTTLSDKLPDAKIELLDCTATESMSLTPTYSYVLSPTSTPLSSLTSTGSDSPKRSQTPSSTVAISSTWSLSTVPPIPTATLSVTATSKIGTASITASHPLKVSAKILPSQTRTIPAASTPTLALSPTPTLALPPTPTLALPPTPTPSFSKTITPVVKVKATAAPPGKTCPIVFRVINSSQVIDSAVRAGTAWANFELQGSLLNTTLLPHITSAIGGCNVSIISVNTTALSTTLHVKFAAVSDFEMLENAYMPITFPSRLFLCPPAGGTVVGSIHVEARPPTEAVVAAQIVQVTTETTVAVSAVAGGTAASDAQMLVVFGQMSCSRKLDRDMSKKSIRALSPAAIDYSFAGLLAGNWIVFFSCVIPQLSVVAYFYFIRKVDIFSSMSRCRFPSLAHTVASLLHQGIAFATFGIIFQETGGVLALGVFGVIYCIGLPVLWFFLVRRYASGSYMPYELFKRESNPLKSFFLPGGVWTPRELRCGFGSLMSSLRPGYERFGVYQLLVINVTSCIAAIAPGSKAGCNAQIGVLIAALLLAGVLLAYHRPYRSAFLNATAIASLTLLAATATTAAKFDGSGASSAFRYLAMIQGFLTFCRVAYSLWLRVMEVFFWSKIIHSMDPVPTNDESLLKLAEMRADEENEDEAAVPVAPVCECNVFEEHEAEKDVEMEDVHCDPWAEIDELLDDPPAPLPQLPQGFIDENEVKPQAMQTVMRDHGILPLDECDPLPLIGDQPSRSLKRPSLPSPLLAGTGTERRHRRDPLLNADFSSLLDYPFLI